MYIQHTLAIRMLNDMAYQNEQIFHDMDVDLSRFGQYDITGIKDADGDPFPRTWDEERQCWSDDWKDFLYEQEKKELKVRYEEL